MHYRPSSWLINVEIFPKLINSSIELISFLVKESNNLFLPTDSQSTMEYNRVSHALEKVTDIINQIE